MRRAVFTVIAFVGSCGPQPTPCDQACQQHQAYEAERQELEYRHQRRRREIDEQTYEAQRQLERSRAALAEARAEQAVAESEALGKLNEARTRVGLPPISTWSNEPGGLTPDGALLLFGGKSHKTYLGCLCDNLEPDSVMSSTGQFGPNGFHTESIWNKFGDYGSSFSDTSPCNRFGSYPPVIVWKDGRFFGYLTLDRFRDKAITDENVLKWLEGVCNR